MSALEKVRTARLNAAEIDWSVAYEELLPRVYHYFCLRTGDRVEAEDLTAATFERAWRDRERYRKDLGAFTNWLFGIARHVLITHYRKTDQEQRATEQVHAVFALNEVASHSEEFERITSVLASLPEREQEVFSLKYGAQFTNRAIARVTGLSESNVGTILHRIINHLRKELENENEG